MVIKTARKLGIILALAGNHVYAANDFYANPDSTAATWVKQNSNDSRAATIAASISSVPTARWFTGTSQATANLNSNVASYTTAAQNANKTPILIAYNIPGRDCSGGASSGGAVSATAYKQWIDDFISGIGARAALVILEPDAIADIECLSADKRVERVNLLSYSVSQFKSKAPAAQVYLDAGNANWKPASTMAKYLNDSGVKDAKGFALNISNFYMTNQTTSYGQQINALLASNYGYTKSMVIDTSRNGNGALSGNWCNPPGRKIGVTPQVITSTVTAVWAKVPGNSDGSSSPTADCHGGPAAGVFSPDLAIKLINGS